MADFLKRVAAGSVPDAPVVVADCVLSKKWQALVEFLTLCRWDDGAVRETGTVLVCFGEGRWRAWLNDRDGGVTAWTSSETLSGLLEGIDVRIRKGTLEWRAAKKNSRK